MTFDDWNFVQISNSASNVGTCAWIVGGDGDFGDSLRRFEGDDSLWDILSEFVL